MSRIFKRAIFITLLLGFGSHSLRADYHFWNVILLVHQSRGLNNLWGYTQDGREYALVVRNEDRNPYFESFQVIDITIPNSPQTIAEFPSRYYYMHEVETYKNYAYTNSGQIFDLSYLPDSVREVGASKILCHTLTIQDDYCYCNEGNLVIFDLTNPLSPVAVATINTGGWVHDSFVRKDTLFIADIAGDTFGGILIYDVQDKANPVFLKKITYPNSFTHSCWTTEDGKYLLTCDENIGGHLKVWDIQDLNNIQLVSEFKTNSNAIIHNVYVKGDFAYIAYYTDGLRVLRIKDPAQPEEVGYYDTTPYDKADYEGAWGAYPYLPSGNILVSDISCGLYILKFEVRGGDYDSDSSITFVDIIFLVDYLFRNGPAPKPVEAGDVNSDCKVNLGDVIYLVNYLFKDGPPPPPACF